MMAMTKPEDAPGERRWSTQGLGFDDRPEVVALLMAIRRALPRLASVLHHYSGHRGYEDPIYRFYHHSFKVYELQDSTRKIVATLQALAPERPLNDWFVQIVKRGTAMEPFEMDHNRRWLEIVPPMVEAFFHARFFLEMAVRAGKELRRPPRLMPSGWAALLYLYNLR
jgi:hypothetical protein